MPPRKKVTIVNPLTAKELSDLLGVSVTLVVKSLFEKGFMRTVHQIVEVDIARKLALDMGFRLGGNEVALPEPDVDEES